MTNIIEQMRVRREEMMGYSDALDQLTSQRQNVMGDIQGFCDQHDELSPEIQAKIAERQERMHDLILKENVEGELGTADGSQCKQSMCQCFRCAEW